jgi:RHS repeat-associated protein
MRNPDGPSGRRTPRNGLATLFTCALITLLTGLGPARSSVAAGAPASSAPPATDAAVGSSDGNAQSTTTAAPGIFTIAAGRTPGDFAVSQSGAASYRIPLWTPPGVGDVDLQLALVYNSRAGNGPLGIGLVVDGFIDDHSLQPHVGTGRIRQRRCQLDERPVLSGRTAVEARQRHLRRGGSVYSTELETFARVSASGTLGNGPASFTVTTKSGLIYDYGSTANSRIYAGSSGTVRTWALARIRDRTGSSSGNSIALTYSNDAQAMSYTNGSFRIASVSYPTTATGQGPFYTVTFGYSARPVADVPSGFLAGNKVREPNELDTITIQAVGAVAAIKTYYLGYGTAPVSGRLRLQSVQECAPTSCLRPTTIQYQDGGIGWSTAAVNTNVVVSANKALLPIDLNADGLTDIVYPVTLANGSLSWRILVATSAGFALPIDTGFVTTTGDTIIPGRFSGNGRSQVLIPRAGYWYIAGIDAAGFNAAATGLVVGGETGAADFDGDGLDDLMLRLGTTPPTIAIRRNLTNPSSTTKASFAAASETIWTVSTSRQALPADHLRVADMNGDGRADIVALSYTTVERNARLFATPLLSNGFGMPFTTGPDSQLALDSMTALGDWNGDGCTDVIQVQQVFISNCAGSLSAVSTYARPAGGGGLYAVLPTDWNGDGRIDLLYVDYATRQWYVAASTGDGVATPVTTGISAPNSTAWFVLDVDGDGLSDLGYRDGNNGNRLKYQSRTSPGVPNDLAVRFTDGFGMQQSPTYASISRSNYTRNSDAVFPEVDFQAPLYVVNQFSATDGIGGTYQNKFQYYGARLHLQGRGFEGFDAQRIEDTRSGLITVDTVHRQFPYAGMHVQRSVYQADGTTRVATWTATPGSQVSGTGSERRWYPFVAAITERNYETGGMLHGALITESTSTFTYGDGYGNPTQIQTSTTDKDPYSPYFNSAWQSSVINSFANDQTAWCIGLPASSVTTALAPGQPAASRTRTYASDPATCRITQQTLEPGDPALKVTTTFDFDGCGNISSVRVVGSNPAGTPLPPRTTSFDYGSRCQLLQSATNPVGHTVTIANDYDFGVPRQVTDPNGLSTTWLRDEFGRRTLETRPDQTKTAWTYQSCATGPCWGVPDLRSATYETRLAADGVQIRSLKYFYDGFERLRYREYDRALGTWTNEVFVYDALGRMRTAYRPYSTALNGYTSRTYDVRDRLVANREFDGSGALRSDSSVAYSGRTTIVTDPLGRVHSTVADVAGLLRSVADPAPGGTTQFTYDSFGNLTRIQDPIGAISTGIYNARGFRTQWTDADAGTWSYTFDSLSELVAWSDAKGQSFSASYDLAGRMISRTEPEGTSTWSWGNSPAAKNVGRLQSVAGYGYTENLVYDSCARLARRSITTDQTYQYDYAYNSQGALDTLTYPSSPVPAGKTGARFRIRYGYSFGALVSIDDVTEVQPRTLWSLAATNDYSSATAQNLAGGNLSVSATYDAATNLLTGQQTGTGGFTTDQQNLAYQWDAAGNLAQRRDLTRNLSETFTIDALDRVSAAKLNGNANLSVSYDAAGNVTQKSDVGAYAYGDAAHPHAVTAAGSINLAYDRNGNLTSRNGVSQVWTSFNLPKTLSKAGLKSQLVYGPNHERWRQVATYQNGTETTHYVGGLLEKESTTSTGVTYWRNYVATPTGLGIIVSRNSDASTSTSYLLTDHLGSTDAVVSDAGSPLSRQSYAAFGARRGGDWNSATGPDWPGIANSTRHGYTSHEMLDNVGLVHMNGRVYDPQLGRFLSVDPVVGDLRDSQSVNAYAYVSNRALVDTDPTGLIVDGGLGEGAFLFVAQTILNFWSHDSRPPPPSATALPGAIGSNRKRDVRAGHVLAHVRRHDSLRRCAEHRSKRRIVDLGGRRV